MNTNQKYVLIGISVVLLLQMFLYTPFYATSYSISGNKGTLYKHGNFFTPETVYTVDTDKFILYWGIILVMGGLIFILTKDKNKNKKE